MVEKNNIKTGNYITINGTHKTITANTDGRYDMIPERPYLVTQVRVTDVEVENITGANKGKAYFEFSQLESVLNKEENPEYFL